jgi:hypothetical protein
MAKTYKELDSVEIPSAVPQHARHTSSSEVVVARFPPGAFAARSFGEVL